MYSRSLWNNFQSGHFVGLWNTILSNLLEHFLSLFRDMDNLNSRTKFKLNAKPNATIK